MGRHKKILVKANKDRVVYSRFKDGFLISRRKFVEVARTPWIEKRIQEEDLIVKKAKD